LQPLLKRRGTYLPGGAAVKIQKPQGQPQFDFAFSKNNFTDLDSFKDQVSLRVETEQKKALV